MATRRNVPSKPIEQESRILDPTAASATSSSTAPAVPMSVIYKLLSFTALMVVAPIGTYFLSHNLIGNTAAGATAAIVANLVLVGYIIVAFKEDQGDQAEAAKAARKAE